MIEHLCVFTKGGRVLWNFTFAGDRSFNAPVNDLVRLVLLEVTGKAHTCLITQWNWGKKKNRNERRDQSTRRTRTACGGPLTTRSSSSMW